MYFVEISFACPKKSLQILDSFFFFFILPMDAPQQDSDSLTASASPSSDSVGTNDTSELLYAFNCLHSLALLNRCATERLLDILKKQNRRTPLYNTLVLAHIEVVDCLEELREECFPDPNQEEEESKAPKRDLYVIVCHDHEPLYDYEGKEILPEEIQEVEGDPSKKCIRVYVEDE